jgi:hypothetical protein
MSCHVMHSDVMLQLCFRAIEYRLLALLRALIIFKDVIGSNLDLHPPILCPQFNIILAGGTWASSLRRIPRML